MEAAYRARRGCVGAQQGAWFGMSGGGDERRCLTHPADVGARTQLRDRAHVGLMLGGEDQDALDACAHVIEGGGGGGRARVELRDVEAEGRGEHAGPLPRFHGADGVLEFLHHVAGGKLPEVAVVFLAVRMAGGDFREWRTVLKFR